MSRRTPLRRRARALAVAALASTVALAVSACGGGGDDAKTTATAAAKPDDGSPIVIESPYGEFFEPTVARAMKRCEANGVRAVTRTTPATYDEFGTKLQVQAASGKAPDLVVQGLNQVIAMGGSEHVVDLAPYLARSSDLSDANLPTLRAGLVDGKQVTLPWGVSTPVLWINEDQMRAKGVDPASLTSWDAIRAAAEQFADSGKGVAGIGIPMQEGWVPLTLLLNGGSGLIDDDGQPRFNDEAGIAAAEFVRGFYADQLARAGADDQLVAQFIAGKSGMFLGSSGYLPTVQRAKFPLYTVPFPPQEEGGSVQVPAGGVGIAMYAPEERRERAWEAVECLFAPETLKDVVLEMGYMPVRNDVEDVFDPGTFTTQPLEAAYSELDTVVPWYNFPGPNSAQANRAFQDAWNKAIQTDAGVQAVLDQAAGQISGLLPRS